MAMKKTLLILLCFLVVPLGSCSLDDGGVNFNFVTLQIVDAELPESFMLNTSYTIKVTYLRPNGCTFFEGFDVNQADLTTREVVAIGSELQDTECTQQVEEVETTFDFFVIHSEDYLFRFWTGENAEGEQEYLEIVVPVEQ